MIGKWNSGAARRRGLDEYQVAQSREKNGANVLRVKKSKSFARRFFENLGDPVIRILLVALGVNLIFVFKGGDLAESVNTAIKRFNDKKPFSLPSELADKCRELLDANGSPDHFEQLLLSYFAKQGAKAKILPKNSSEKIGDCDVEAVFPLLHLTISVQAKKHWGQTGDWAVQQITDYAENRKKSDNADTNWSYINWVVSFAEEFTESAVLKAQENGIVLINGRDFCKMLIAAGLDI